MIENIKDYKKYIERHNKKFLVCVQDGGGFDWFARAIIAKMLLFVLYYSLGIRLMPAKNVLFTHLYLIVLFLFVQFFWKSIKKRLPIWIDEVITGEIFFQCKVKFLNYCIASLFVFNIFICYIPVNFIKNKGK